MLTLKEKKKKISSLRLEWFRERLKERDNFQTDEFGELLDYIDFLEKENARLRRSII